MYPNWTQAEKVYQIKVRQSLVKGFLWELRSTFSSQWRCFLSLVADFSLSLEWQLLFMFRVSSLSVDARWAPRHSVWSKRGSPVSVPSLCTVPLLELQTSLNSQWLGQPPDNWMLALSLTVITLKEECWMWKKITCLRSLCQTPLDGEISVAAVPCFYFSILNVKLLFNLL